VKAPAWWLALLVAAPCLTSGGAATADTTDECIAESEAGQRLLLAHRVVEARSHLVACGRAQCPSVVLRDCAERLRQAEASVASVLLVARRPDGTDATDVRVFIDQSPTPYVPTGEAIDIDPGPHTFRFVVPGAAPVVRQATVEEGVRLQRVIAELGPPGSARREPQAAPAPAPAPLRSVALTLGAIGVLGLGTGAVLGLMAMASGSDEKRACPAAGCSGYATAMSDYTAATRSATASTVAFAVGGALLSAGVVLWLTAPPSKTSTSAALQLSTTAGPTLGGVALRGAF